MSVVESHPVAFSLEQPEQVQMTAATAAGVGAELGFEEPRVWLSGLCPCYPAGLLLVNAAKNSQSLARNFPNPEDDLPTDEPPEICKSFCLKIT